MEQPKTIASDKLLMNQFHDQDWEQLWIKLLARCVWLLRNRYSVQLNKEDLNNFSRKMVSEIIEKIFVEKDRKWNTDRYPDFEDFIIGVIDSHVNNTLNKKVKESPVGENEHILEKNSVPELSQDEKISTDELREQMFDELERAGADDDELLMFECLADGIDKPDDIKKELGINDKDFHNTWRRFKRKRKVIQQKLAAHGY